MLQSMSVWLLVGITIDRYLAVCHPFKARVHCTWLVAQYVIINPFIDKLNFFQISPRGSPNYALLKSLQRLLRRSSFLDFAT